MTMRAPTISESDDDGANRPVECRTRAETACAVASICATCPGTRNAPVAANGSPP